MLLLPNQNFFSELQDREEEFGISDIQLGLTTLEEVFLNIARQAELESAAAEGSLVTLTLTSGESVQVRANEFCFQYMPLKRLCSNWLKLISLAKNEYEIFIYTVVQLSKCITRLKEKVNTQPFESSPLQRLPFCFYNQ